MAPTSATTAAQNPAARMGTCSRRPIDPVHKSVIGIGPVSVPVVNDLPGPSALVMVCGRPVIHVSPATAELAKRWPLGTRLEHRHQSR
jgi:hypothetical protein